MIRITGVNQWVKEPGAWFLPILITLASFNGLVKAITGVRYGPLLIDAALLALLSAGLVASMNRNRFSFGILDIGALIFMIFALFEIFNPNIPSLQAGLEGFRKFAFMMIGFFIGRYLVNVLTIKRLIFCLLVSSFIIALYGIKQYIAPSALDYRLIELSSGSVTTYLMGGHIRAFSTLSGPFHLGIYLVATLLLSLCIWYRYKQYRLWVIILAIPQVIALIMTVTKSNWAALVVGGLVVVLLNSNNPLRVLSRLFLLGLAVVILGVAAFYLTGMIPQLKTIHDGMQAILNPLQAPTMVIRLNLWRETIIPQIQKNPWLGYGTGSAGEGLAGYFVSTGRTYAFAHNVFIKVIFELGVFGLLIFLLLLALILGQVWKVNRYRHDPLLEMLTNWGLAFAAGMLVSGLTGSILDAYPVNLIFWIILGVSSRAYHLEQSVDTTNRIVKPSSSSA